MAGRRDELSNLFTGSASRSCGFGPGTKDRGTFRFNRATGQMERVSYQPAENKSAAVHQDTLKKPLRHMKTGELTDSKSRLEQINREHGLKCVGNDLETNRRDERRDKIDEPKVLDRMQRAESVLSDPSKLRARNNQNLEILEKYKRLVR